MHELSLSRAIVETATRHAGARRVVLVSVTIGALRQVAPKSLTFYFEIVARGTVCEGAVLEARLLPARMRCACGEEWELQETSFRCPACGGGQTSILDGDQLSVDSIEVEEEIACTAPG
jgi:hydrogenase nickel incorporation protein HypA/HybF